LANRLKEDKHMSKRITARTSGMALLLLAPLVALACPGPASK
jgi:hypothetical protein